MILSIVEYEWRLDCLVMAIRCMAQFVGREKLYSSLNIFQNCREIYQQQGLGGFFVWVSRGLFFVHLSRISFRSGLIPRWLLEVSTILLTNMIVHLLKTQLSLQKEVTPVYKYVAAVSHMDVFCLSTNHGIARMSTECHSLTKKENLEDFSSPDQTMPGIACVNRELFSFRWWLNRSRIHWVLWQRWPRSIAVDFEPRLCRWRRSMPTGKTPTNTWAKPYVAHGMNPIHLADLLFRNNWNEVRACSIEPCLVHRAFRRLAHRSPTLNSPHLEDPFNQQRKTMFQSIAWRTSRQ